MKINISVSLDSEVIDRVERDKKGILDRSTIINNIIKSHYKIGGANNGNINTRKISKEKINKKTSNKKAIAN